MALRVRQSSVAALALALALEAFAAPAKSADIEVILDEAKLVNLPEKVATIVIGNPLIADATIQSGGLMVITGKGYGSTNIIALDRRGAVGVRGPAAPSSP